MTACAQIKMECVVYCMASERYNVVYVTLISQLKVTTSWLQQLGTTIDGLHSFQIA